METKNYFDEHDRIPERAHYAGVWSKNTNIIVLELSKIVKLVSQYKNNCTKRIICNVTPIAFSANAAALHLRIDVRRTPHMVGHPRVTPMYSHQHSIHGISSWAARMVLVLCAGVALGGGLQAASVNDDFGNATVIPAGLPQINVSVDITGNTVQAAEPGSSIATAWWTWTPTTSGPVVISTKGSAFDTVLSVYVGTGLGNLVQVVSNDEYAQGDVVNAGFTSLVSLQAISGTTYRILIGGYAGSASNVGVVKLSIQPTPSLNLGSVVNAAEPATNGSFTFMLSSSLVDAIQVNINGAGTASFGTDFTVTPNPVVIPANATSVVAIVAPVSDAIIEGPESVIISVLSATSGEYQLATPLVQATMTLNDAAAVIYVDGGVVGGATDGSSWANAYSSLTTALAAATTGRQVWVKSGTYKPTATSNRNITFTIPAGVELYGGFNGSEVLLSQRQWYRFSTILSGDILATPATITDDSYHVVNAAGSAVLDGLVITRGNSNSGTYPENTAGGVLLNGGNVTIRACRMTANAGSYGGAFFATVNTTLSVNGCVFDANSATSYGGVMDVETTGNYLFTNCVFMGNSSVTGGALSNWNGILTAMNCTFLNNTGTTNGAVSTQGGTTNVTNSIIRGNTPVATPIGTSAQVSSSLCQSVAGDGGANVSGNTVAVPSFMNEAVPAGPDGFWTTADDGLAPGNGSVALNTANAGASGAPQVDIIGRPRPLGAGMDRGAYERPLVSGTTNGVHYVNASAYGTNNGSSWKDGYIDLQSALAAAVSGDQIWVAAGTYFPTAPGGSRDTSFVIPTGVQLYGDFIGNESAIGQRNIWAANRTVLSGNIGNSGDATDNSKRIVLGSDGCILDGFTVSGGYNPGSGGDGSAFCALSVTPTAVRNCVFTDNTARRGAGMYNNNTGSFPIDSCIIANNNCQWGSGTYDFNGGGLRTYRNCIYVNNIANSGFAYNGAGHFTESTSTDFVNCIFYGGQGQGGAAVAGGAISVWSPTAVRIKNCILWGNSPGAQIGFPNSAAVSTVNVSFSVCQGSLGGGGTDGGSNSISDPLFQNTGLPRGADGVWGTADDGLRVSAGSVALDTGSASATAPTPPVVDLASAPRPGGAGYDKGAYESRVIYVDLAASGANTGTSWTDAYTDLQSALGAAISGDEIWVAKGVYKPTTTTTQTIFFTLKAGISLYGGFFGNEIARTQRNAVLWPTELSGNLNNLALQSDNSYHVINYTGTGTAPIVDGFTIRGGNATSGFPNDRGGAVSTSSGPVTIRSCIFQNNAAVYGGAIVLDGSGTSGSIITTSAFDNNSSTGGGGAIITLSNTSATIISNSVFTSNSTTGVTYGGGACMFYGAGAPMLLNCTLRNNSAPSGTGGGIHNTTANSVITDCILWGNTAPTASAISVASGIPVVTYCDIQGGYAGTGNLNSDPGFISPAQEKGADGVYFTADDGLKLGSTVCVNSGTTTSVTTDILGNARPIGGSYDMGAYEGRAPTVSFALASSTSGEAGGTATMTVAISSAPDLPVTIGYRITGGTATTGADHTLPPTGVVTFPAGSNASQTISIPVVNDDYDEIGETVIVSLVSATNATLASFVNHSLTITDNDTAGYAYSKVSGFATSESGTNDSFTFRLTSRPTADVTVTFTPSSAEVQPSPASVTFLAASATDWSVPRTITLQGQNDDYADGDQPFTVSDGTTTADVLYIAMPASTLDLSGSNADNDTAGFVYSKVSGFATTEAGGTDTFIFRLSSRPTNDVTVTFTPGSGEVIVSPSSILFDASSATDWNAQRTVSVIGQDDSYDDNDQLFSISDGATTTDTKYQTVPGATPDLTGSNADDDTAGFEVTPLTGLVVNEDGGAGTFAIRLSSKPTQSVSINLSSNLPSIGTVSPNSVVFNPDPSSNWNQYQYFTVTGSADSSVDGNQAFIIQTTNASSSDTKYGGQPVPDIAVTRRDNDVAGLIISTSNLSATEGAGFQTSYSIRLATQPAGINTVTVTILTADNQCEVDTDSVAPGIQNTLSFNNSDWNGVKFVQVRAPRDSLVEGAHSGVISHLCSGTEPAYNASLVTGSITAAITDGDTASVNVSESSGSTLVSEATPLVSDSYDVALGTRPSGSFAPLADLNPAPPTTNPGWGSPSGFTAIGAWTVFAADDGIYGSELWRIGDTAPLKDINPGVSSANPANFVVMGGFAYFAADDGINGSELWKTDGTASGTTLVGDVNPIGGSYPNSLTVMNGKLYFVAYHPSLGNEWWVTDGTIANPTLVADIQVGSGNGTWASGKTLVWNNRIYFAANDGATGFELWSTDGTSANTTRLTDANSGSNGSVFPWNSLVGVTGSPSTTAGVYFLADADGTGDRVWYTDGTVLGTSALVNPDSLNYEAELTYFAGYVWCSAYSAINGREITRIDGSTVHRQLWQFGRPEADISPGSGNGSPNGFTVSGSVLYFSATDIGGDTELWQMNSGLIVSRTLDLNPTGSSSPYNLTDAGGTLVFAADDGVNGVELHTTGGFAPDLAAGMSSSNPSGFAWIGSSLYYSANDLVHGDEIVVANLGTSTQAVIDINSTSTSSPSGSIPAAFARVGSRVWFSINNGTNGRELAVSDGTISPGTAALPEIEPGAGGSFPSGFVHQQFPGVGGLDGVVFSAYTASGGRQPYFSDGTTTTQLWNVDAGTGGTYPDQFVAIDYGGGTDNIVFFSATSIGTGPNLAYTYAYGPTFASFGTFFWSNVTTPAELVRAKSTTGDMVYLRATASGYGGDGAELYAFDPTLGNIRLIADVLPGGSSNPHSITRFANGVLFVATDSSGTALFYTDGTPVPTRLVSLVDAQSIAGVSSGIAYFSGNDGVSGFELWKTDGTVAGTVPVADLAAGPGSSNPGLFAVVQSGTVVFKATTSTSGTELWRTDGTAAGTVQIRDLATGPTSGMVGNRIEVVDGLAYVVANDAVCGNELWCTDGTASGTSEVRDLTPGFAVGSSITELASLDGQLIFNASTASSGSEVWGYAPGRVTVTATPSVIPIAQVVADTDAVAAGAQTTMTFTSSDWNVPHAVTVNAIDDPFYETSPHPGVIAHVASSTGRLGDPVYDGRAVSSVSASVADNDSKPTIAFLSATSNPLESAGDVAIEIDLSAALGSGLPTDIPFNISGSATPGLDFTVLTPSPVTIPAFANSIVITIRINNDTLSEDNETLLVTLGTPTNADLQGGSQSHLMTIDDSEDPLPSVSLALATPSANEATTTRTVTANLNVAAGRDIPVYFTLGGSATLGAGKDYTCTASPVIITAGNTSASITLTVNNDVLDEEDETVDVAIDAGLTVLATPSGVVSQTVTIVDNDAIPTLAFSADQSAAENIGTMTATLTLSALSGRDVTVAISDAASTATSTALGGNDYTYSTPVVIIQAGTLSMPVSITVIENFIHEASENVVLDITSAQTGATPVPVTVTDAQHIATITDNDAPPRVQFSAPSSSVNEGTGIDIAVELVDAGGASITSGLPVSVPFSFTGSAGGTDYTVTTASPLVIAPTFSGGVIHVDATADGIYELNETAVCTMGAPTGASPGGQTVHTLTIFDPGIKPVVEWTVVAQASADETASTMTVTASLTNASGKSGLDMVAPFTITGSATLNTDYTMIATSPLTIPAGSTSVSFQITILPDALDEGLGETVVLTLDTPTDATVGTVGIHTATITDDDSMPTLTWTTTSQSSTDESGTLTATATLSAISSLPVDFTYTLGGTATYLVDATVSPGLPVTVTIPAGSLTSDLTINIISDFKAEGPETVVLTLASPVNATLVLGSTDHTATITDDDTLGLIIAESGGSTNVAETGNVGSGTSDTYDIQLGSDPTADVTVHIAFNTALVKVNASSVSPVDLVFTASGSGNTWAAPQTVTVTRLNNAFSTDPTTTLLVHTCTGGDYGAVVTGSVTVNVTDDDIPGVAVTESGGATLVDEAGTADSYSARLYTVPAAAVTMSITVVPTLPGYPQVTVSPTSLTFTTLSGDPYVAATGVGGWDVPHDVIVTAIADGMDEPDGHPATIQHAITSNDGAFYTPALLVASVTPSITDNDPTPQVTVADADSFANSPTESGTILVPVTLDIPSSTAVTVNYAIANITATNGVGFDYNSPATGSITWLAGASGVQNITIPVLSDSRDEANETIAVTLTAVSSNAVISGGPAVATIFDDDLPPSIGFAAATSTPGEAAGTRVDTIAVNLSAASGLPVTVSYAVSGGTASVSDYSLGGTGTLTIPAGSNAGSIVVTVIDDAIYEGAIAETVNLILSAPSNATPGAANHTVSITDNETPPTVSWNLAGQTVLESTATTVSITATLSGPSALPVTVPFLVGGTATGGGTDYVLTATVPANTLTITSPSLSASLPVTLTTADGLDEADETVVITMTTASLGNATVGANTVHTLTIQDLDATPTLAIKSGATQSITENSGNTDAPIAIGFPGTGVSGRAVTVPFTIHASSTAVAADYTLSTTPSPVVTPATSPLTIPAGANAITLYIHPINDNLSEVVGGETLRIDLGTPTNATISGQSTHTVTINDAQAAPVVNFTQAGPGGVALAAILETGGTATATLTLANPNYRDVIIPIATGSSTATIGSDASLSLATATILAGSTTASVTVTALDDFIPENNESIVLGLGAITNGSAGVTKPTYSLIITDDDLPVVTISKAAVAVTEGGSTPDTFTVVLGKMPAGTVTVTLSGGSQVTLSPATLAFDSTNYSTAQTVTVTAINDAVAEGVHTQPISFTLSGAPRYSGMSVPSVTATITDNDIVALVIAHTGPIQVDEAGATDTCTIALASQPTGTVTVTLSPDAQQTVNKTTLTFTTTAGQAVSGTTSGWNVPQTITVTAVDDAIDEASPHTGTIAYAASGTNNYTSTSFTSSLIQVLDNDTAAVTVLPASGLTTTEAGGIAVFAVVLTSQPTAQVVVKTLSSATTEGLPSVSSLTFNASNWFVPRLVTVTGANDFVDDGDQSYIINLSIDMTPVTGTLDANYLLLTVPSVSVTNIDNDAAGVAVGSPVPANALDEATPTVGFTYTVVLTSQPTGTITITPVTDGQVTVTSLSPPVSFDSSNWNVPKIFTVKPVDDALDEASPHSSIISHTVSGPGYLGISVATVTASITDNDSRGVNLSQTSGIVVDEAGTLLPQYTIVLATQPITNVTVDLTASDTTEGTVSPAIVTFTSGNWNIPKPVTVTGVDDFVKDGNQNWQVQSSPISADPNYGSVAISDVGVTTTDDEITGILISTGSVAVAETGTSAVFTVVLKSQPTVPVTIPLVITTASASPEATVSPASLTFTFGNWNVPQNVTVTGVDDAIDDGTQAFTVVTQPATSGDPNYNGMNAADVAGTTADEDTRNVLITQSGGFTAVTEGGATDSYTVVLASQPTAPVTISVAGNAQATASPASLTFTTGNWSTAQTVTVTAVDDQVAESSQSGVISHSASGGDYAGFAVGSVTAQVSDNDTAGLLANPVAGLNTSETGTSDTFTVRLTSQPASGTVVIDVTADNPLAASVSPATVTFTAVSGQSITGTTSGWDVAQTITVTGLDDAVPQVNAAVVYHIDAVVNAIGTADPIYVIAPAAHVAATNADDDTAAIALATLGGFTHTSEAGGTVTALVSLISKPTGIVDVTVTSSNPTEASVPASTVLSFDSTNWDTPQQQVVVTGLDDTVDDGDIVFNVHAAVTTTGDFNFNLQVADLALTNDDNDASGISITPTTGLTTDELGGSTSFDVVLLSQPAGGASVVIDLTSSNFQQGVVSPSQLTFTASGGSAWNNPQTVTITGVDTDGFHNGNVGYTIVTTPAVSIGDPVYNGYNAADVSVTNLARNNPPTLSALTNVTLSEDAGAQTISLGGISTGQAGESQTLVVTVASTNTALIPTPVVSYASPAGSGSISFTPVTNANGTADITVTVTDDGAYGPAKSVSRTFTVTVNAVNDAPTFTVATPTVTVLEDAGATVVPAYALGITSGGGADESSVQTLTFNLTTTNDALFNVLPVIDPLTGVLTFKPEFDTNGSAMITATLSDDGLPVGSLTRTFTIAVTSVNDQPQFDPITDVTILEDAGAQAITITNVSPGPLEGAQTLSWTASSSNSALTGTVSVSALTLTTARLDYTPVANAFGGAVITVTATDTGVPVSALTRTFNLSVTSVNDAPVISGLLTITNMPLRGDITITPAMLNASDVDLPAQTLTVNVTLPPGQGELRNGTTVLDPTDGDPTNDAFLLSDLLAGNIHYVHGGGGNSDGFAITVSDGTALSSLAAFKITINRQPPSVTLDSGTLTFTENGAPLVVSPGALEDDQGIGGMAGGSLIVDISNVGGLHPTETIGLNTTGVITLTNVLTPPIQVLDSGTPIGTVQTGVTTAGVRLEISLNGNATPPGVVQRLLRAVTLVDTSENPTAATRTVTVTIIDGDANVSAVQTRDIVVVPVNDAPVVTPLNLTTAEDVPIAGNVVASDYESNPLTYTVPVFGAFNGPAKGQVTLNSATGAFIYTPNVAQTGADTFVVTVDDQTMTATNTSTVPITIQITGNSVPRPWIISDPPMEMIDATPLTYTVIIDASDLTVPTPTFAMALLGTLPAGSTYNFSTVTALGSGRYSATLTMAPATIGVAGLPYLDLQIRVTETSGVPNTSAVQPMLIRVITATGGG